MFEDLDTKVYEIDEKAVRILDDYNHLLNYARNRYIIPPQAKELLNASRKTLEKIDNFKSRNSLTETEEVVIDEINRNIVAVKRDTYNMLNVKELEPKKVIRFFSIPEEDLDYLGYWLRENKKEIENSIEKDFDEKEKRYAADSFIPKNRQFMEKEGEKAINLYHDTLKDHIVRKSGIESFKKVKVFPTWNNDYLGLFNSETKIMHISLPSIFYTSKDDDLLVNNELLIKLYGHEGYGHGAHFCVTDDANLPKTIKKDIDWKNPSTESISQYFEKMLIEDIRSDKDVQNRLGIDEQFEEMYFRLKNRELFEEFLRKRTQYAIYMLSQDNMQKEEKLDRINEVSFNNLYGTYVWDNFMIDEKLRIDVIRGKLIYAARPVERSLELIEKGLGSNFYENNRNVVDNFLLEGIWTPEGFMQKTELFIKENK